MKPILIIVPLYKSYHLLEHFINCIQLEKILDYNVVFIDNTDGIEFDERNNIFHELFKKYDFDKRFSCMSFLENGIVKRCMYSESVNKTIEDYDIENYDRRFLIFNPDHIPHEENWLSRMITIWDKIEKDDAGICTLGTLQYFTEDMNAIWHFGCDFKPIDQRCHDLDWHHNQYYDGNEWIMCDGNTGSGIMIDVEKFKKLNMFDVDKYPHYSSDADFCLRASEYGYSHYCSNVITIHTPGKSSLS